RSEPIALEVHRSVRPQARVVDIARDALRAHKPRLGLAKGPAFLRDDEAGNLLVVFRNHTKLFSRIDHTVAVGPDGKAATPTRNETFTCVARGTLVATERGARPIEEVRVGDRVWGYDTRTGKKVLTTVRFVRV